jgi:hypothetical protein
MVLTDHQASEIAFQMMRQCMAALKGPDSGS